MIHTQYFFNTINNEWPSPFKPSQPFSLLQTSVGVAQYFKCKDPLSE